jgi:hypothetical protein
MPKITFDLDDDSYDKLSQLAQRSTLEAALAEILVEPISRYYFLEFAASKDYFEGRPPVTDEEAETARRFVISQIPAGATSLPRPEAVIYGLYLAAHDLALKLCEDARYEHPDQHGEFVADNIFRQVQDIRFRAAAKSNAEESEKLARDLGVNPPEGKNE